MVYCGHKGALFKGIFFSPRKFFSDQGIAPIPAVRSIVNGKFFQLFLLEDTFKL